MKTELPPSTQLPKAVFGEKDARLIELGDLCNQRAGDSVASQNGLLLHDHGAKFDIGKEKVIEPWDEPPEKIESARKWIT
ncbi:MAG: hypothetical protein L0Z50_42990, partial [Verrucomicrobiales bacterium]|nr:hypothetical protein [Verrucomicrobiales bacterium]